MAVYLSLTVLLIALATQFYCICKYLAQINNLEVKSDCSRNRNIQISLLLSDSAREPRAAEVITQTAPGPGENTTSRQEVVFQAESHCLQWNCEQ